ncbi:hypothetical protein Btru_008400 [Bulinus truncatus]|nr:hypothetical protein Btru_008400 [Bulinus truncatus]
MYISLQAFSCDVGKFGELCEFQCHCHEMMCGQSGQCLHGSECQVGYFGHLCQYEDLAYNASSTHTELFDGDDTSCQLFNMNITTVRLDNHYPMTFIRIYTNGNEEARRLYLESMSRDNVSKLVCGRSLIAGRYKYEFDYFCQMSESVQVIDIYWMSLITVCSVRISGEEAILVYGLSQLVGR